VGFTIATIDIGQVFQSQGVTWVGSAMTCLLVVAYLFILFKHVQAVWRGQIIMGGKDEDVFASEKMTKVETRDRYAYVERGESAKRLSSRGDVRHRPAGVTDDVSERHALQHTDESVA
jgi:hypothetical protein